MTEQRNDSRAATAEGDLGAQGLKQNPSAVERSAPFFYPGATREQRLNLLLHLVPLGEVLLITGVAGVGKTALLEQFLARRSESWRLCRLDASGGIDSNQLLQQLVQAFAPEAQGEVDCTAMERLLISQLQLLHRSAQQPMLLIDNAEQLSESGFRALSKLITDEAVEEKRFGVVLFGEPAIAEKLGNPALQRLRSQIKHTFELPLLSEEETQQYLEQQMQAAGLQGKSPFTAAVNRAIFRASKGLPLKINELAQAVLQNKRHAAIPAPVVNVSDKPAVAPVKRKKKRLSLSFIWPFLVAGVLASVLVFQDEINALFNPPVDAPPAAVVENEDIPLPVVDTELPAPVEEIVVEEAVEQVAAPPEDEVITATAVSDDDSAAPANKATAEPAAVSVPASVDPVEPPAAESTAIDPPATTLPVAPLATEDAAQAVADAPQIEVPATEAPPDATPLAPPEVAEESWVMAQPSQAYTLQIVAQAEPEKREAFITRFGLDNEVERFSTNKQGQRWYVAVIGLYDSRRAALEASRQLPAGVVPWVRSFASIKKELWRAQSAVGETESSTVLPEVTATASPVMTDDERWVMARPADHFALQLAAFKKPARMAAFIEAHPLASLVKQVRLINQGALWFVALYGDVADRRAALQLADNLEQEAGVRQPWVRSYGSLQRAMRQYQQQ